MKRLILCSISCLAFAVGAGAQDKPPLQLIPPQSLLEFPSKQTVPNGWVGKQGLDLQKGFPKLAPVRAMELRGFYAPRPEVCSVPLLEAHAEAVDPGIAFTPQSTAVAIPQAHVPAPACAKK